MFDILIATKNKGKIKEIKEIFKGFPVHIVELPADDRDIIKEDGKTYLENALKKAKHYAEKYHLATLADDSGLEIDALNGAPGINSARFLGEKTPFDKKIERILALLKDKSNRKARFKTALVMYLPKEKKYFHTEGKVEGEILRSLEKKEGSGFGYDPIFKPDGFDKSFSALGEEVKNRISHRRKALNKMKKIIEENFLGGDKMIEIKINGKRLVANKYVYDVFKSLIFALLGTLKNMPKIETVEITIKDEKNSEGKM